MQHSFDVAVAEKYGVIEAILINNLAYWLTQKKANNKSQHDGKYWVYNSVKAFKELYPYLTDKQIRRALENLRKQGAIETANYNADKRDRTLWYSLTKEVQNMLNIDLTPEAPEIKLGQAGQNDLPAKAKTFAQTENNRAELPKRAEEICPQRQNRFAQKGKALPLENINIKQDISSSSRGNIQSACAYTRKKEEETAATAAAAASEVRNFWFNNTGRDNEVIRADIADLVQQYGSDVTKTAMAEAIRCNVYKIPYVKSIAERIASGEEWTRKKPEAFPF